jgi:hypothetical protein
MQLRTLLVIAAAGLMAGCGKEAGRTPFAAEGEQTATMELKAGEVALWTDIDLEWEGDGNLSYKVELVQNGTTVASAMCNPLGNLPVKSSWVSTDIGSKHSRRGNGKMPCDTKLAVGGPTTVKSTLAWGRKPASVTMKKADLVVKQ